MTLMDEPSPYLHREPRAIEEVMSEACARGRKQRRGWRKTAADRYEREFDVLRPLVGDWFVCRDVADTCPAVTWEILRHLCWHIHFNRTSPMGSLGRAHRIEMIAAGEARLLFKQWATRAEMRRLQAEQAMHDMIEGRG